MRPIHSLARPPRPGLRPLARLAGLGALGALGALTAACSAPEPPTVRIGLIGVLTGQLGISSGLPARQGARLAVDELNAAGGIGIAGVTHRLVLVEQEIDNRSDAASVGARSLINLDSVHVIIGPQTSTLAVAAAPVAEESEVVMIAPMASNPAVTQGRRYVFRLAFLDPFQGLVLARFAYDSLGIRHVGVLRDAASPYSQVVTESFTRNFTALGGRVGGDETYDSDGSPDHSPQLRRLLSKRPQAILLPGFVTAGSTQLRQARALGFTGTFLGTDSWDVRGLGPISAAYGSVVVANWDRRSERPAAQRFIAAWNARYPEDVSATAAATYDAVRLVAAALSRAGTLEGIAVADAMRASGRYDGAVTEYDFRGANDPARGAVIMEVSPTGLRVRATIPAPPS